MEIVRTQAKELFPTVYLTLISIIQALALETLWETLIQLDHIWTWSTVALIGWLEISAVFELIFLIWLTYAHTIMRVRWVVSVHDSVIPFALGLVEFALVALIHPARVHLWCYTLAIGAAIATWASITTRRAARAEPDNAPHLAEFAPRRPLAENASYVLGGGLALLGALLVQWQGEASWVALAVVALGNVGLLAMIAIEAMFWRRAVAA